MAASESAGRGSMMLMLTNSSHGLPQEEWIFTLPTATCDYPHSWLCSWCNVCSEPCRPGSFAPSAFDCLLKCCCTAEQVASSHQGQPQWWEDVVLMSALVVYRSSVASLWIRRMLSVKMRCCSSCFWFVSVCLVLSNIKNTALFVITEDIYSRCVFQCAKHLNQRARLGCRSGLYPQTQNTYAFPLFSYLTYKSLNQYKTCLHILYV